MKKNVSKIFVALMVLTMTFGLGACSQKKQLNNSEYVGKWEATYVNKGGLMYEASYATMELSPDGKAKFSINLQHGSGTWTQTDTGITVSEPGNDPVTGSKTAEGRLELTFPSDGSIVYFEKQSDLLQKKQSEYIGTWKVTSASKQGISVSPDNYNLDYRLFVYSDGKAKLLKRTSAYAVSSDEFPCKWTETEKSIFLTSDLPNADSTPLTLNKTSDGKLELTFQSEDQSEDIKLYFEKQPE